MALVCLELRELHAGAGQRVAQPLDRGFGFELQRVVGLHPQHQVDAALEVEAQVDLLAGRVERPDGQGQHDDDGDDSILQVLVHDWPSVVTGSWPW